MMFLQKVLPILVIFSLTLLFFGRLFWPQSQFIITPDFGLSDIFHLNLPLKLSLSRALKQNQLPFIEPQLAAGFPVFAEMEAGTFNIFNLLFFKILDPFLAFNLTLALSFFLTTFFTYQYLRELKLKTLPSLFSATAFGFSFYLVTQISHHNIVETIVFLPAMLFFLEKYLRTKKPLNLIFFSLCLSQQIFSGFPQTVFISLLFLSFYALCFLKLSRKLWLYLLFVSLGLGLSAIQLWPTLNYFKISTRGGGMAENSTTFSYPFKHLMTLVRPFALGNPATGTYPPFWEFDASVFWENSGYFGILALIFAISAIFFIGRSPYIRFFLGSAFFAFLFMTGKYSPLYFIFSYFPLNIFRVPSRFILVFVFSSTILAGLALDKLLFSKASLSKKLLMCFLLALNLFDLFRVGYDYHPLVKTEAFLKPPATVQFLANQPEKKIFNPFFFKSWNDIFLKEGWQQPEKYLILNNNLRAGINTLWNIPSLGVYQNFISRRYQILNQLLTINKEPDDPETMSALKLSLKLLKQNGVDFIISPYAIPALAEINLVSQVSGHGLGEFYVYQLKNSLAFAKLTHQVVTVETLTQFVSALSAESFDLDKTMIADQQLPSFEPQAEKNAIKIVERKNNRLEIVSDNREPAYLVLQQAFLPGWQAQLNNQKVAILPVNLNQMAIFLPAGKNIVKLHYLPEGFMAGLLVSAGSLTILLILFLYLCRTPRRNPRIL